MDINTICQMTTNPEMLNTLHACREGHPLGKDNPVKWLNALAMASQNRDINSAAVRWLQRKAAEEANMNVDMERIKV